MDLSTLAEATTELLSTTRSVRKRLDLTRPVPDDVVDDCLRLAVQAPTGSNRQDWAFVVVNDADTKLALAGLYRRGMQEYSGRRAVEWAPDDPRWAGLARVVESSNYLGEHIHEVPLMVIPCIERRPEHEGLHAQSSAYAAIIPAAWSFMLAARSRGIGTCWTSVHLLLEAEARQLLGIPDHVTQAGLIVAGYYTGETFRPAARRPLAEVVHRNRWGVS
jgi:nitroreductase